MGATRNTEIYLKARDLLLGLNGDYAKAVEQFAWPELEGHFNWALDWFDVLARSNDQTALWIVEEDGSETRHSFDEMARRSNQVAAWLAAQGVAPRRSGDAHARQPGRALGVDAGGDEARRGDHADHHRARAGGPARTGSTGAVRGT